MSRKLIAAAAMAMLSAGAARAQVSGPIPGSGMYGDSTACCFNTNLFPDYDQVRSPEQRERDRQIEIQYREQLARIPNKRPASNDPWKNIRPAPAVPAYDRHRPQ